MGDLKTATAVHPERLKDYDHYCFWIKGPPPEDSFGYFWVRTRRGAELIIHTPPMPFSTIEVMEEITHHAYVPHPDDRRGLVRKAYEGKEKDDA